MGLLKKLQSFRERMRKLFHGRFENFYNYVHTLSWLNISIVLNLFLGVIFLCTGLILLTGREENQVAGWVFFAISLCMLLLGLFLLIVRCMFPAKSSLPTRHNHQHPRRRHRRPNQIYDGRPRSQPNMQAAPQPSPATVWTTPASELESRTLTEFIARMNFENAAQCSPVTQAPPTYEQAVGRPSVRTPGEPTTSLDLPPAYQAAQ